MSKHTPLNPDKEKHVEPTTLSAHAPNTQVQNTNVPEAETLSTKQNLIAWFRQAMPYINTHRGKTFVIMLSGDAVADEHIHDLIHDLVLLNSLGIKLIIVHGIRKQLDEALNQHGIDTPLVHGLRVTDLKTLDISIQTSSLIRAKLETKLSMGLPNSPMHGASVKVATGNVITAKPAGIIDGIDLQQTGLVRKIDHQAIANLLDLGNIVLLSPIGYSPSGQAFNINYQHLAAEIASATQADKLIAFVGYDGMLDQQQQLIHELTPAQTNQWLSEHELPLQQQNDQSLDNSTDASQENELHLSIKACLHAVDNGVPRAHLMNYANNGALLQELFSVDGSGTLIQNQDFEILREATAQDIPAIVDIIRPLEKKGILVRRERDRLEEEIHYFYVLQREGLIIALAALYPTSEQIDSQPKSAEIACIATHPDYQGANRGARLLLHLENKAKSLGMETIFVLSTQTIHWFIEQGFQHATVEQLPQEKKALYNFQRNSKVLIKQLN